MGRFKPNDEEMALISLILQRVIYINEGGAVDVSLEIDEDGVNLFAYRGEGGVGWNNCETASTEKELIDMYDWLLEQERKVIEIK